MYIFTLIKCWHKCFFFNETFFFCICYPSCVCEIGGLHSLNQQNYTRMKPRNDAVLLMIILYSVLLL